MPDIIAIVVLTVCAIAIIPLLIAYYLWLARTVLPRVADLPPSVARTVLAVCIAVPWIAGAIIVWALRG